jgi:DNA topoisomerase VI subunit B
VAQSSRTTRRAGSDNSRYPAHTAAPKVKTEQSGLSGQRIVQLAESPVQRPSVLLFEREDWSLYTSLATLPQRAGVPADMLPLLVAKEFTDNALDSADAAGRPGAVTISVDHNGNLIVEDEGTGIPGATSKQIATLFCVARPLLSSKLLRKPTRGAVGNGLRVCVGYLAATNGRLVIETGTVRVEFQPEIDGTSREISTSTIKPRQGLRLTAIAGHNRPFAEEHITWAQDAIELARQSGAPAYTGRPSAHWLDLDHFRVLLSSAVGNPSVRQFLDHLDGCSGSRVRTRIAARFSHRLAADLTRDEAVKLLAAAQEVATPPESKKLRALGRRAVVSAGYAITEGEFSEGENWPKAKIPFLVECWAVGFYPEQQPDTLQTVLFMNRTRALTTCGGSVGWNGYLTLSIANTPIDTRVPEGPHYSLIINITAPMFRLTSDGKTPDCKPFRAALREAIEKAANKAGREIAVNMSAEQKRADRHRQHQEREQASTLRIADREARKEHLALIEEQKAERRARPTIRSVVLELLPASIERQAASGLMFGSRRLVYDMRDEVLERTGKELLQGTFDTLITELEAKRGDLHPLHIREARGCFSIPHQSGDAMPLGTLTVRDFYRPAWTFNKIVAIEKEDLRLMLRQAGWDRRHDALLMSAKGFNTRAARDLIDKNAETTEPLKVYSAHDADAAGTLIQHTVQHATLARGERKIKVIDIGLQPWEGVELRLRAEKVPITINKKTGKPRYRPVGAYVRARTDFAPNGETWEQWLQHNRYELNAFTSAELIEWLDRKMAEAGDGKLIPPDDILQDGFGERVRARAEQAVAEEIAQNLDAEVAAIDAEQAEATKETREEILRITADLRRRLAEEEKPFLARKEEARADATSIDREAETQKVIERIAPSAEKLRTAISETFAKDPSLSWSAVLDDIADETDVEGEGGDQ